MVLGRTQLQADKVRNWHPGQREPARANIQAALLRLHYQFALEQFGLCPLDYVGGFPSSLAQPPLRQMQMSVIRAGMLAHQVEQQRARRVARPHERDTVQNGMGQGRVGTADRLDRLSLTLRHN